MTTRISIIQGHPDPAGGRLGHALADAYAEGAIEAGHDVQRIGVADLDFPLLRTEREFEDGAVPDQIRKAQDSIAWAEHIVILYPLWLGTMPALLKGFLEQVFRPEFAFEPSRGLTSGRLKGRTARVIVTMGMPVWFYRWYFGAHSLRSLERNILRFCGISPVRDSLFGMVKTASPAKRSKWLAGMRKLGRKAR